MSSIREFLMTHETEIDKIKDHLTKYWYIYYTIIAILGCILASFYPFLFWMPITFVLIPPIYAIIQIIKLEEENQAIRYRNHD
jgi:hypothetical protein